ncbi:MAG: hypothetical protein IKG40_04015 [Bacilli bacterium]|nr:hypothetical protein [Bacilli bacterium]
MSRKLKNIIMICILVLTIGGIVFTLWYAKDHVKTSQPNIQMNGSPPSMPNDNNSNSSGNTPPSDGNTPPEKPDGDNSNMTSPDMSNSSGDTQSDSNDISSNSQNGSNQGGPGGTPPNMHRKSNSKLSIEYYIILGGLGLLASINIVYLAMTRFNKKTLKELFKNKDKIIIYTLTTIILTTILTFSASALGNSFINNNTNKENAPNINNNISYSASTEISENKTITSGNYSSEKSDENAILVTKDANISNVTVTKTGDSDGGDSTSFYGNNSAILAKSGATLNLKNIKVRTDATGANGVFSYGGSATTNNSKSDGTTVNISDSTITTSKDNSGGIMTTGGGIMNATNLKITTSGTSSAAIRSDRGGGTVTVNKGTYKTVGKGSPVIYSTANIIVKNASLTATSSEGVVIEGKNSVILENVNLTDTNNTLNGQSTTYKNIFLYQSMSGDAASGNSKFTAKDSKIITNKGDTFYITNTSSEIVLENNTITNNDKSGNFLRAKADSWGSSGSNGGIVTLKMINQNAEGNIVVDNISTLDMTLKSNSTYKGTINGDKGAKSIKLVLDKTSKIVLTGDSYVTSLDDEDSTYSNIDFNGYKLYVNGKAISK